MVTIRYQINLHINYTQESESFTVRNTTKKKKKLMHDHN